VPPHPLRRLLPRIAAVIVACGLVVAASAVAMAVPARLIGKAGSGDPHSIELGPLAQRSYVFSADGSLQATLKDEENRQPIPLADVPPHVVNAILSVEDAGFWIHDGFNVRGMLRAFKANVDAGGISQGGSTITQQLVKLDQLSSAQTLDRKVQELFLASRLEKEMTKEEILDRYLNTVYFGNHSYGIQAAAETYFGVGAQQLDIGQAAMLAGIIRNPINYNPIKYPDRAQARRNVAIDRMVATGALTHDEGLWWHGVQTVPQLYQVLPKANDYFPSEVEQQLLNDPAFAMLGATPDDRRIPVYQGGLKVFTTFDPAAQAQAIAARDQNLPLENGVFNVPGVDPITGQQNQASAAVVSVEPSTGAIRTMVGGPGFDHWQFNLATHVPGRQVGSSMKTFVLATLMEQGYSPDDIINGTAPCDMTNPGGTPNPYHIENFADGGGSVGTITAATLASSNCAFVRLGLIAGSQAVVDMAHKLGITSPLSAVPSLPLGTSDITPLEMASAYATLANDGVYNPPYMIERIEDSAGNVIYQHAAAPEQRVSPQVARLVTSILIQNVQGGTGTAARIRGQQAAGKTGTTQGATDGWFVGYTPSLSTAVWVGGLGAKFPIILGGVGITGGRYPARIWGSFMNAWQESRPAVGFPPATPVAPSGAMLEVPGGRDLTPPPAPPPPPPPDPGQPFPFPFPLPTVPGPPGQTAQAAPTAATATATTAAATRATATTATTVPTTRGRPPPTQTTATTGIPT
jgi:penicillin-binding protein 1A